MLREKLAAVNDAVGTQEVKGGMIIQPRATTHRPS